MPRIAFVLLLVPLLTACPAKQGSTPAAESASAVGGRLVHPESLPPVEPSMQRELPTVQPAPDTATGERATMARLEREARALAKATGCTGASACRTAPVGARACGGPRTYIVYCAATTDTVALMRKLRELERVEKSYNERSGMMSTCEMRMAPGTTLVGGSCREATTGAGVDRVP